MQVIEVISLRAIGVSRTSILATLESHMKVFEFPKHLVAIECHAHADVESDLSIHIIWQNPPNSKEKSPLCLLIEDAFKVYGLIDSNTWIQRLTIDKSETPQRETSP